MPRGSPRPSRAASPAPVGNVSSSAEFSEADVQTTPSLTFSTRCAFFADLRISEYGQTRSRSTRVYRVGPAACLTDKAMADTGCAKVSVVGSGLLDQLPAGAVVEWRREPTRGHHALAGADGKSLLVLGRADIMFSIHGYAYRHTFHVVEGGQLMLLGNDFLVAHGGVVDVAAGKVVLSHHRAPEGRLVACLAVAGPPSSSPGAKHLGDVPSVKRRPSQAAAVASQGASSAEPAGGSAGGVCPGSRGRDQPSVGGMAKAGSRPKASTESVSSSADEADATNKKVGKKVGMSRETDGCDDTAQTAEADHEASGASERDDQTGVTVGDRLQFRNHVLYADAPIKVPPNSEVDVMVPLPMQMRGKRGVLLVDRLPERPGFDRTLTACSLSEIQNDRIRVRVIESFQK